MPLTDWIPDWRVSDWAAVSGSIGEFVIAGVIYYELEENRAATFLANVQNPKFLDKRVELYKAYVGVLLSVALRSLSERATKLYERYGFGPRDQSQTPLMVLPIWSLNELIEGAANKHAPSA